jgi:magnesium chelatase family protein
VVLTRARHSVELPCRFLLVAAANDCPCGHGPRSGNCDCSATAIRRYEAKLSGALADRVDIALTVERPSAEEMSGPPGESSATVRDRVAMARRRQEHRLGPGRCNAEMDPAETRRETRLTSAARLLLASGHERLRLSGRGYDRVLRLARTLADLYDTERVEADHVGEALNLRRRSHD